MASSIIRDSLQDHRRARHEEIGFQGEQNVIALLNKVLDSRLISYSHVGYSDGTNGNPDIVLKVYPPIAIEVKSVAPFTPYSKGVKNHRSVGYVKLNRNQWLMQKRFARDKNMNLIVIVEVRILNDYGEHLYLWLEEESIDECAKLSSSEWIHISLWELFVKGRRLITIKDIEKMIYLSFDK